MSNEDFAILVGISIYPNPGFSNLRGPPEDLELMKKWLTDPKGGAVPDDTDHIVVIRSPEPYPKYFKLDAAPPVSEAFDTEFRKLHDTRMKLEEGRLKGRLYLYFSGHGFCYRSFGRDSEAALYSANATKSYYDHIFGTHYARLARGFPLFQEVVLIMDCCRDSEVNRKPTAKPYVNSPDDQLATGARLLATFRRKIDVFGSVVNGVLQSKDRRAAGGVFAGLWL